jgi:chromosome segregation ATPase
MLLSIASVASALKFSELAGVTPMEKVITLLEELKAQVQDEGAAEAATYKDLACFCEDNQVTKADEIATNEQNIDRMEAELVDLQATLDELDASIKSLTEKIGVAEAELKEMTAIRDKEHAIFEAEFADASGAVDALVKAIQHLMDAKSKTEALAETKADVQKAVSLADAMGLEIKNQKSMTIFLSMDQPEDPGEYEFQSGGIVDTLKDLKAKFEARKDELQTEEDAAQQSYEAAAAAKRDQIDTDKATLETEEESFEQTKSDIATTTEELTEEKAQLNDNNLYLKDITATCEMKAKEWDQRSVSRGGEITAISKALEILTGTVQGLAESTGAGGRTAAEEAAPIATELLQKAGKQAAPAGVEEYRDVVFTQVGSVQHQKEKASMAELRRRVITKLSAAAKDQKSLALATLVMKLARDPFAKVKVLIQKLIERLLTEAKNEATHKGWCDTEIGKAEKDREYRHADSVKLNAAITDGEATIAKLKETIETLTKELGELNEALLEATKQREQDKANNKKTLKDAKEGLTALEAAIKVLTDYYKGGLKSKNRYEGGGYEGAAFVQASPVAEQMGAEGVEGGAKGAYAGNQAQGQGIIGMLETIASDFKRTLETTEAEEYKASRDFAAFSQETKASISTKETGKKQAEADLDRTSGDLVANLNSLKDAQELLDMSLETLEKLRPACVDTGMSYEERVARREHEIEALKEALCVLDEEDGEIPECAGGSYSGFLQKSMKK